MKGSLSLDGIDLAAFVEHRKQCAALGLPAVTQPSDLTTAHISVLIWTAGRRRDPEHAPSLNEVRAAMSALGPWRMFTLRQRIVAKLRHVLTAATRAERSTRKAAVALRAACADLEALRLRKQARPTTVRRRTRRK